MEKLHIEKSVKCPLISADPEGNVKIEGISVPENAIEFYEPLKIWLTEYLSTPSSSLILEVKLDYFNTSTASILLSFFKLLNKSHNAERKMQVNWYYEDNDLEMQESGNDFKSIVNLPFNLIPIKL